MKKLIFINGTMGVGKTTTCRELKKLLPKNVFLDGDWCWDMSPFIVNDETKSMVISNICFLLNNFIKCSEYENIIFCWVMHEQSIIDTVLSALDISNVSVKLFSLVADKASLEKRLEEDIQNGIRTADVIERSVKRIEKYNSLNTEKIDVSNITPMQAAEILVTRI
ncbi:AAA family ATPase [Paludicola sp. MB14-C6]|uniref:AAA family ATPase n=1 Tax=Paludihabitans sp. MB14-C6 TaxID=3070656 RepID=UPI0027DACBB2|nr:AAA family ATPase [Paludicola sp. MB14-C6]WMJ23195.1 AAA family ATPase [Paludicola sp. MB14-C6]